jgi:hypothetical protein
MGGLKKISRWVGLSFCIVSAATAISACSGSSPTGSTSAANTIANSPLGDNYKGPPTPCDGDLSVKDAVDLINGQTAVNHYSMLASMPGEGCELGAGQSFSAFIDIAITKSKPQFYANMLQFNSKHNPLPGVGDEAVSFGTVDSNIPDAKEINIMARKGEWVCRAELIHKNGQVGDKVLVSTNDDENAKKLGALCSKLFVAKHS